ncbi:MAG: zinc metallopeptidase [Chloroflexi bacterium]|nr:zinc metallopeptidase [Chloroflexota bacterium]
MPFFDPLYFVFAMPALLVMLYAQFKVKSAYGKYSQVRNMLGANGAQIARRILDSAGLSHVPVEMVPGDLSDHYDPRDKVLRLSPGVYKAPSVAAMGIAAHEVGHAIQDHLGYVPMRVRAGLVPVVNLGSTLGYVFFILGFVVQFSGLVWLGVALFSAAVVFALVTLPVELNASSRALHLLRTNGLVSTVELDGAKSVLSAAALTYVAALLQAVGQLLYWVLLATGMGRRDD